MIKIALGNAIKLRKQVEEKIDTLQKQRSRSFSSQIPVFMVESNHLSLTDLEDMVEDEKQLVSRYTDEIFLLTSYMGNLSEAIGRGNITPKKVAAFKEEVCVVECLYKLGLKQNELRKLQDVLKNTPAKPRIEDNVGFLSDKTPVYVTSNYALPWLQTQVRGLQEEIQKLQNAIDEINLTLEISISFYENLQKLL